MNRMLAMTVTEIPLRLEPVTEDTFLAPSEPREVPDSGIPSPWHTVGESTSAAPRSRRS
jgi:hypothetical protein